MKHFLCFSLRFIGDFQLFYRDAVAPEAHEALLWRVAEGVFTVLAVEGRIAQAVEEFPGAVKIQRVNHHCLEPRALIGLLSITNTI